MRHFVLGLDAILAACWSSNEMEYPDRLAPLHLQQLQKKKIKNLEKMAPNSNFYNSKLRLLDSSSLSSTSRFVIFIFFFFCQNQKRIISICVSTYPKNVFGYFRINRFANPSIIINYRMTPICFVHAMNVLNTKCR